MYMQFYRKVYLGNEHQPHDELFINWRNLPPRLDGWMGSGALDVDRYHNVLRDIGNLPVETDNEYFKRFLDSDRLRYVARNLENYLNEHESEKTIGLAGRIYDRGDVREISRILFKLADTQYFAELRY